VIRSWWVALAALTLPGAAGAADGWDLFGPASLGAGRAEISARIELECTPAQHEPGTTVCRPAPRALPSFAGVPVQRVELVFRDDRLEQVAGRVHEPHFAALEAFVVGRNGAGQDCSIRFRAGMAGDLLNRILLWRRDGQALVIEQFQGKIDRSAFTYGTAAAMAGMVREKTAYPPGSFRDL
jgi:hypothetical protein